MAESRKRNLTQDEQDCLWIYRGTCRVHAGFVPDYQVLERTAPYLRGRELSEALHGPVVPFHEDPHALRSNMASLYFERLHGREPVAGDVLLQSDWEMCHAQELLEIAHFVDAWHRQLHDLLCPLKIEDGGRVFQHERVYRSDLPLDYPGRESLPTMFTEWREDKEATAERWWDSMDYTVGAQESEMNNIQAITFLGVIDGEHRCRPSTEAEIA